MDLPWNVIVSSTGTSAAITVLIVYIARRMFDQRIERADAAWRRAAELSTGIDVGLRTARETVYAELWCLTGKFPKWPRARDITYADLLGHSKTMQRWYFESGGIYLSSEARKAYGRVQVAIASVLSDKVEMALHKDESGEDNYSSKGLDAIDRFVKDGNSVIEDSEYTKVMRRSSSLRTELTNDLLSRRSAPLST